MNVLVNKGLIEEFLDHFGDTPCRLDHHGYCQEHWLGEPCIVPRLREILKSPENASDFKSEPNYTKSPEKIQELLEWAYNYGHEDGETLAYQSVGRQHQKVAEQLRGIAYDLTG